MKRIIEKTEDGSATLYVPELDEHYHSVKGAWTESDHIFLKMGLRESHAKAPNVLEIGFGTGLNALLTQIEAEEQQRDIVYSGIELYPLDWETVDALHYTDNPMYEKLHRAPWDEDVQLSPHFTLRKIKADFTNFDYTKLPPADVVYFDAFAPDKQPEVWTGSLFEALFTHMASEGILTTYCAKGVVRRMLQHTGFKVERIPGPPGGKREILRARKETTD